MKLLQETLAKHAERVRQQQEQMELPNFPPPLTANRAKDVQCASREEKMTHDPLGR